MEFDGLVCVVTGASSGFGREACLQLARRGATIIAVARREELLRTLVGQMLGNGHSYIAADLSSLGGVRDMAYQVGQRTDHVDILMNNAGIKSAGPLHQASSEAIQKVLKTNLLGPIFATKELLPLLKASNKTRRTPIIVNVASIAGRIAIPFSSDYTSSKFGLVGFTEALHTEAAAAGMRVMLVNPGPASTEGFPMDEWLRKGLTRPLVMDERRVVRAMLRGIARGSFEVRVQWWLTPLYYLSVALGPLRRIVSVFLQRRLGPQR